MTQDLGFTFLKRSGKLLLSAEVKPCNIYCATPTNCWAATAWTELKPALPPEPANVSLYLPRKTRKFARKAPPPTLPLAGAPSFSLGQHITLPLPEQSSAPPS